MVLLDPVLAHDTLIALGQHGHQHARVLQRVHHLREGGLPARKANERLGKARVGAAVVIGEHRFRDVLERFGSRIGILFAHEASLVNRGDN